MIAAQLQDVRYLAEFRARHPEIWNTLENDEERLKWLITIFNFSRFLSEELLQHPEWLFSITDLHRPLALRDFEERLATLAHPGALELALFRRRQLLRIVLRDALGIGTLPEITGEISNLADAILQRALDSVRSELQARYGLPIAEPTRDLKGAYDTNSATFAVLALGKLGGRELNYSSDIDLMFLYGDNGNTTGPQKITNREFFKKVANQFTNLLSTYTAEGICYRVDLRLRPEGNDGEVCLSLNAAKDYYSKRARDWELQMLIKARVAAGDESLGQALLEFVEPLIYSTTLNFSTIESMSVTRERMAEKLARKRLRKHELDVKLARGGIRDIEFLVQCLQRLHGAREPGVRHGGTLLALSLLLEKDLLSPTEYSQLVDAYQFLRQLEHRLQFENDQQTHALPATPEDLECIARRMPSASPSSQPGITPSAQLLQDVNHRLENVQDIYDRIVHAQRPLYYSPHGGATSMTDAGMKAADDRRNVGVPEEVQRALQQSPHHPVVDDYVIQIFETSPFLAGQLTRNLDLLDEIHEVAEHRGGHAAFEARAGALNDIDSLRRFFQREMFRIQTASICVPEPIFQTLDRTSAVAEFVIARAYRIALERGLAHARAHATAEKPFQHPQSEMMVVALGRLGMREFDLGSDADVLFIIPDHEANRQRFWTRVAEHLMEILTTYTGEGVLLSLDTRLRPNGREGMLVQSESKYVEYFSNQAEAWEGIAYMKARGIAGDTERATNFLTGLQQVDWRRYGQSGRSKHDLRQMRMRLQREQGPVTPLKAGYGGYYDADFILMYLRLKGAGMFYKKLNTPERIDIVEKMGHLERGEAEFLLHAITFFRALDHAIRLVTGRAEEKLPDSGPELERIAALLSRWTGERAHASTLAAELLALETKLRRLFDTVFA
jgi:glutamate-ammonia-ligase adenylyltransferase